MVTIRDLEPWFAAASSALSLATLAFIINLAKLMSDAAKSRAEVLQERLSLSKDQLEQTEKWNSREQQRLSEENNRLEAQLKSLLDSAGFTTQAMATGRSLASLDDESRELIEAVLAKLESAAAIVPIVDSSWHLQAGRASAAAGNWPEAASHYDQYTLTHASDWQAQFMRGVAHANTRAGSESDLSALRAYNEAMAFAPISLDENTKARIFDYRGAILKRLSRLEEAEADLQMALNLASKPYEAADIKYNLACVYAMRGDRTRLFIAVNDLQTSPMCLAAIRGHLHDYFARFARDEEFLHLVQ